MFLSRNKKNNIYPCKPQFYYTKVGFKGSALLYRYVFVMCKLILGYNNVEQSMVNSIGPVYGLSQSASRAISVSTIVYGEVYGRRQKKKKKKKLFLSVLRVFVLYTDNYI